MSRESLAKLAQMIFVLFFFKITCIFYVETPDFEAQVPDSIRKKVVLKWNFHTLIVFPIVIILKSLNEMRKNVGFCIDFPLKFIDFAKYENFVFI